MCTREIYLDRKTKSLVHSSINFSSPVLTFYHSENTLTQ